jgi:hypothetical protein
MRRTWIPLATGLLLALTACGGGGSSAHAGAGASHRTGAVQAPASDAAAPSAGSTRGSTAGSTAGSSVDVCTLLPASDVSRITGVHYTKAKSSSVMGQIFGCEYSDSTFDLLQISVALANGSIDYDSDVQAMSSLEKPDSVSGVGDKAFAAPDPKGNAAATGVASFASYGALFGDVYIKIGGSYVNPDQGKQIVDQIDGKL